MSGQTADLGARSLSAHSVQTLFGFYFLHTIIKHHNSLNTRLVLLMETLIKLPFVCFVNMNVSQLDSQVTFFTHQQY